MRPDAALVLRRARAVYRDRGVAVPRNCDPPPGKVCAATAIDVALESLDPDRIQGPNGPWWDAECAAQRVLEEEGGVDYALQLGESRERTLEAYDKAVRRLCGPPYGDTERWRVAPEDADPDVREMAAALLSLAAERVGAHGWTPELTSQYSMPHPRDLVGHLNDAQGELFHYGSRKGIDARILAEDALRAAGMGWLHEWQTEEGRTQEDVVDLLRRAWERVRP